MPSHYVIHLKLLEPTVPLGRGLFGCLSPPPASETTWHLPFFISSVHLHYLSLLKVERGAQDLPICSFNNSVPNPHPVPGILVGLSEGLKVTQLSLLARRSQSEVEIAKSTKAKICEGKEKVV